MSNKSYILLIDTLSVQNCLLLFSRDTDDIFTHFQDFARKEFEELPGAIDGLLAQYYIRYDSLDGIVILNGPGSFTGTRVTCLVANSIAFAHKVPLYPIDYFVFLSTQGVGYPQVVQANRREVLLKQSSDQEPKLIAISDLPSRTVFGTGDTIAFGDNGASLCADVDHVSFVRLWNPGKPVQQVQPWYVKDPTITLRTA